MIQYFAFTSPAGSFLAIKGNRAYSWYAPLKKVFDGEAPKNTSGLLPVRRNAVPPALVQYVEKA